MAVVLRAGPACGTRARRRRRHRVELIVLGVAFFDEKLRDGAHQGIVLYNTRIERGATVLALGDTAKRFTLLRPSPWATLATGVEPSESRVFSTRTSDPNQVGLMPDSKAVAGKAARKAGPNRPVHGSRLPLVRQCRERTEEMSPVAAGKVLWKVALEQPPRTRERG